MSIIWQACAEREWCVQIPFDGKKCIGARACIRVLEENGDYFLEIEIAGARERMPLGNSCLEARYYVFAAKVCVANMQATPHSLDFDVVLRLCIDANIGPIHIGECVDIYRQHVRIGFFTVDELAKLDLRHPMLGLTTGDRSRGKDRAYAYVETALSEQALQSLTRSLADMR